MIKSTSIDALLAALYRYSKYFRLNDRVLSFRGYGKKRGLLLYVQMHELFDNKMCKFILVFFMFITTLYVVFRFEVHFQFTIEK